MSAFAFPFRFVRGRVPTLEENSDQYAAQSIASIIQTEINTLPITPSFGTDPAEFEYFDVANLTYNAARYFPDIEIQRITQDYQPDGSVNIQVAFERLNLQ